MSIDMYVGSSQAQASGVKCVYQHLVSSRNSKRNKKL